MEYKKKEEVSFENAKIKAGQSTVQVVRNLLIPEAIVRFGWVGQVISNRKVPMDKVPNLVIIRSLDAKVRVPTKGRRVREIEENEGSSDEESLLELGYSCRKKRPTDLNKEEYMNKMMRKLKLRIATEMNINIE